MKIYVYDKFQQDYSYDLHEPIGENFAADFKPELTPAEMLILGVFEGKYMTDCGAEFPKEWFLEARHSPQKADEKQNCFLVKSRLSLKEWQKRGWIYGPDPRGWFQWYCRYYHGRRLPKIDEIQIKRWQAMKRHKAQILQNCQYGNITCRPKQRQTLLQWAYNPFF